MAHLIEEELEPGFRALYKVEKTLHSGRSAFQTVDIVDLQCFGRTLLIDGMIQSSQIDEFVYHESLVHPVMLLHATGAKTVYIGGGGEGSTAREVLRHRSVTKCVMVDIDADVVNFCKMHLPENAAAFADPRLHLVIDDAKGQLESAADGTYDIIIMDLDDPLEGGPCYQLYTKEFYKTCYAKLAPGGILVTQSGQAGSKLHTSVFSPVNRTLREAFPVVSGYNYPVYSFCDEWGWNVGFKEPVRAGAMAMAPEEVDRLIKERMDGENKFLDGESYQALPALSKQHRATLAAEQRVLSTESGTFGFMHSQGLCVAEANGKK
jgi:thermospermine synthase